MTIEELIRLANKQEAVTNLIEKRALRGLSVLTKRLLKEVNDKVLKLLELDSNGKIKRNTKNRALLSRLKNILESASFVKVEDIINDGSGLQIKATSQYFKAFVKAADDLELMRQNAIYKLMKDPAKIGVNKHFRQDILDKIQKGIGYKDLIKGLTSPTSGSKQVIFDSLHQRERIITKDMGDYVGLKHYIYTGGLVDRSREFCVHRNRKVFTTKEINGWESLTWEGKSSPYDPFIDVGGYRCRHRLMPISKEMYARYKGRVIP